MRLIRPVVRASDWTPTLAATAAVLGMAVVAPADAGVLLLILRMSAVLLGAATAFLLVDPMTASTEALPMPRWRRQGLRSLLALTAAAVAWSGVYAIATVRASAVPPLPGTAIEALVCAAAGLAAAAFSVRRRPGRTAALAGLAVPLILVAVTLFLRGDASPWAVLGAPRWDAVHRGWAAALLVPIAILVRANRGLVPTRRRRARLAIGGR